MKIAIVMMMIIRIEKRTNSYFNLKKVMKIIKTRHILKFSNLINLEITKTNQS